MFSKWIIDKIVKKGDYLYAVVPSHPKASKYGYVLHHRIVMENKIKRQLSDHEIVHHIDGNKHHNLENNLEIMTKSEHTRLHQSTGITFEEFICPNCQIPFQREKRQSPQNKGTKLAFCSRQCNGFYYKNITNNLHKKDTNHGINMYRNGCRCDTCKKANTEKHRKYRLFKS